LPPVALVLFSYILFLLVLSILRPPSSTLFPYTTLFRSRVVRSVGVVGGEPRRAGSVGISGRHARLPLRGTGRRRARSGRWIRARSEEHTSELQSRENLVCRLLLEKKKNKKIRQSI